MKATMWGCEMSGWRRSAARVVAGLGLPSLRRRRSRGTSRIVCSTRVAHATRLDSARAPSPRDGAVGAVAHVKSISPARISRMQRAARSDRRRLAAAAGDGRRRRPTAARSAKAQPSPRSVRSGTRPGMVGSSVPRVAPSRAAPRRAARVPDGRAARTPPPSGRPRPPSRRTSPSILRCTWRAITPVVAISSSLHAAAAHQFVDQHQHLVLQRHVQRRGWLVGDQQVRARRAPSRSSRWRMPADSWCG